MTSPYQTPDHNRAAFARTNVQTIAQRAALIRELLPSVRAIAEVCCGDCSRQWTHYRDALDLRSFVGLDIDPRVVAANQAQGIDCACGDALDPDVMRAFLAIDLIFFGPPLSINCDGHSLIPFRDVTPAYGEFTTLMFGDLQYRGTIVCIGPPQTSMGDIQWLYNRARARCPEVGLRLVHHSYATVTGTGETTGLRLKYVEAWLSTELEDRWEVRESKTARDTLPDGEDAATTKRDIDPSPKTS